MKICTEVNAPFVVPSFIIQDASHAEANAAFSPSINPSVETTSVASNLATTNSKRITRSHNKANDKPPLNVKEVKKTSNGSKQIKEHQLQL